MNFTINKVVQMDYKTSFRKINFLTLNYYQPTKIAVGLLLAVFVLSQTFASAQSKGQPVKATTRKRVVSNKPTAEHLLWPARTDKKPLEKMTFIYGEVEVLFTAPATYFCPVQWQGGFGGAGYCGLQQQPNGRRNIIFSVWDTSKKLLAKTVQAGRGVSANKFGHEGSGQWTTLDYPWKVGQIFRFVLTKNQDMTDKNTLTSMYFFDERNNKWKLQATISSPTNGDRVRYFGGGVISFLENWSGEKPDMPRLCLIRLWGGTSPDDVAFFRNATGDGHWGVLSGCYYLAHGNDKKLNDLFAKRTTEKDKLRLAEKGTWADLATIEDNPLSSIIMESLGSLTKMRISQSR